MTMLKAGKIKEIADEMLKKTIGNNSLTRIKMGVRRISKRKYKRYCSCSLEKTAQL